MIELLFSLLVSGAKLAASSALGEFSKAGGKSAYEAIKSRLIERHKLKSLSLLEDAADNPAFEAAVKADLEKPAIAEDAELLALAETLRESIEALSAETRSSYAVNIDDIMAGGSLLFDAVEGIRAKTASSQGDMTFKNVRSPSGN